MSIQLIRRVIDDSNESSIRLFFVTRGVKQEKRKRVNFYRTLSVDIEDAVRKSLWEIVKQKIQISSNSKDVFEDYVLVADEHQSKFKYARKEKLHAFLSVLDHDLINLSSLPKFKGMESLQGDSLWAYCIGFFNSEDTWVFAFSRITQRIELDKQGGFKKLFASMGTDSTKLQIVKGEPYSLDKRIDTIYYNKEFYIFQKRNFEEITGLKEEHQEVANVELDSMKNRGFVQGLDGIREEVIENSRLVSKLNLLQQNTIYQEATNTDILQKLKETAFRLGIQLQFSDINVVVNNKKDFEALVKILTDYYKEGTFTHAIYGTSAGKRVDPSAE